LRGALAKYDARNSGAASEQTAWRFLQERYLKVEPEFVARFHFLWRTIACDSKTNFNVPPRGAYSLRHFMSYYQWLASFFMERKPLTFMT
jgi:hypothetical protein